MNAKQLVLSVVGTLALAVPAPAGTALVKNPGNSIAAPAEETVGITLGIQYDSRLIYHGVSFGESFLSGDVTVDVPLNDTLRASFEAGYGNVFDSAFEGGDYQRMIAGAGLTATFGAAELQ